MGRINISDILLWILFIIAVGVLLWYLLGNSPTLEQTLLFFILTVLFGVSIKVGNIGTRIMLLERSFHALAQDFKEHIKHK